MLESDSVRKIQVDAQFTSAPLETISNFTSSKTISQVKYTNSQFSIHLLLQKQFQISQFHSLRFIGSKINFTIHCTGEELQVHEYLCCRYSVSCFSSFTHLFAFLIIEGTVCTTITTRATFYRLKYLLLNHSLYLPALVDLLCFYYHANTECGNRAGLDFVNLLYYKLSYTMSFHINIFCNI